MEAYLLLSLFGMFIGVFGTLIGAGGGFILAPVLLLLYPHERPEIITSISLAVTFANALSGSTAYAFSKRINYRYGLIFSAVSIPGAVIGAMSTSYLPRRLFDIIFAGLLILASIFIFFNGSSESAVHEERDIHLSTKLLVEGLLISVLVGFISSFLGIGGGIIHVPALTGILGFPVHIATATSHFILAIVTFIGMMVHILSGTFDHGIHRAMSIASGVLIGAQFGAILSSRVKGTIIIRALAAALFMVGVRLIIQAL